MRYTPMPQEHSESAGQDGDPLQWLAEHGDALFGFAMRRVQRHDVAEDLVQDTLLAGFQSFSKFDGRSGVRTWLIGILKNKIIDHYRREVRRETNERKESKQPQFVGQERLFRKNGQWIEKLGAWSNRPEDHVERDEFWRTFNYCLGKMPAALKAVFVLREMDSVDTASVCEQLDITEANAAVRLYRARINLRTCLEKSWFQAH